MPANCAKILSIATATPPYRLAQTDIAEMARKIFSDTVEDFSRFLPVYQNAAIDTRYSSVPLEWYESPSSLRSGATLTQLVDATGWQKHSVHGALANFKTKDGIAIVSTKTDGGERVYKIA